jgi:hypothetical protein
MVNFLGPPENFVDFQPLHGERLLVVTVEHEIRKVLEHAFTDQYKPSTRNARYTRRQSGYDFEDWLLQRGRVRKVHLGRNCSVETSKNTDYGGPDGGSRLFQACLAKSRGSTLAERFLWQHVVYFLFCFSKSFIRRTPTLFNPVSRPPHTCSSLQSFSPVAASTLSEFPND